MSGKLVILLLALSCVAQGYSVPETHSYAETRLTIDEIVKTLNELVSKLREALGGFGKLLEDIEKRIKDILNAIDVPGILAEIQKRIEAIIKAAGIDTNAAASCLKAESEAVQELASAVGNGVTECVKLFDPVRTQIQQQIADITADSSAVINGITGGIAKCFTDHPLNPIKLAECVKGLVDPNVAKVNAILDKISKAIKDDQALIADTADKVSTCVEGVAKDVDAKKEAIIDQFQKCVDDIIN